MSALDERCDLIRFDGPTSEAEAEGDSSWGDEMVDATNGITIECPSDLEQDLDQTEQTRTETQHKSEPPSRQANDRSTQGMARAHLNCCKFFFKPKHARASHLRQTVNLCKVQPEDS